MDNRNVFFNDHELPIFVFGHLGKGTRRFITHKGISLIEIISHRANILFQLEEETINKTFNYLDDSYTLVYHTCNVEYHSQDPIKVLEEAFKFYKKLLIAEDTNTN